MMRSASRFHTRETQITTKEPNSAEISNTAENLKGGFTRVPNLVFQIPLSCAAKLIYEYLLRCCRQKDYCWPSLQRIASDIGISSRTVVRGTKALAEAGLIEKMHRGWDKTNLYHIKLFPKEVLCAGEVRHVVRPESAGTSGQIASNCHTEEDESKNIKQEEYDSKDSNHSSESMIRSTSIQLVKERESEHLPTPAQKEQGEQRAIGIVEPPAFVEKQKNGQSQEQYTKTQNESAEPQITREPETSKEMPRAEHAKEVKENRKDRKSKTDDGRTKAEIMAIRAGISLETVHTLNEWMQAHERAAIIPTRLEGIIKAWSYELGNAERMLTAANVTQASKLYMYARINGLPQMATEGCLESAREVVRRREDVEKKMAFFFKVLRLDILIALKQEEEKITSLSSFFSQTPDGYDDAAPALPPPPPTGRATPTRLITPPKPEPEPEPALPTLRVLTLPADCPQPNWKTWATAKWWGETLRDELDPTHSFTRYEICQTKCGHYCLVLSFSPKADPVWEEYLGGTYITSEMAREALKMIPVIREGDKIQEEYEEELNSLSQSNTEQAQDPTVSQPQILPPTLEENNEVNPVPPSPPSTSEAAPTCPATQPEPESEPTAPTPELLTPATGSPEPEWKTRETAKWWGEALRDELDPTHTITRYTIRQTKSGHYYFELSLLPQAGPVWEEQFVGSYITSEMVRQTTRMIRAVCEADSIEESEHQSKERTSPRLRRYTNTARRHIQSSQGRVTRAR